MGQGPGGKLAANKPCGLRVAALHADCRPVGLKAQRRAGGRGEKVVPKQSGERLAQVVALPDDGLAGAGGAVVDAPAPRVVERRGQPQRLALALDNDGRLGQGDRGDAEQDVAPLIIDQIFRRACDRLKGHV